MDYSHNQFRCIPEHESVVDPTLEGLCQQINMLRDAIDAFYVQPWFGMWTSLPVYPVELKNSSARLATPAMGGEICRDVRGPRGAKT
jgi:hypothetical protein